tara:strand:- start:18 stop:719 length:702 start_codon:yes stop_codon:yes gene_type:complete
MIKECNDNCIHIDGDGLRDLFQNFDYTPKGRIKNIQSVLDLCRFLDDKGFTVVVSVVAPYREMRESLKSTNKVTEVYVHTTEIRGRENYFAKDYQPPLENFISIDTTNRSIEDCLEEISFNRTKKNTYFCDIDGTIFKYRKFETYTTTEVEPIKATVDQLNEWYDEGHMVVLTTARPEELREHTIEELELSNVPYDKLIMGIERGPRYIINDMDPNKPGERAIAINLKRDEGI